VDESTRNTLLERVNKIRVEAQALASAIVNLEEPTEPGGPAPAARQRAVVTIGTTRVQRGKDAVIQVSLTCPEPIAGVWLNLRHSPRLEYLHAESPLGSLVRYAKSDGAPDHSRHLLSFTTDVESGSAVPGQGLMQFAPETVILEVTYRCVITLEPGRYPVDGGRSGAATPGVSRVSWPTLLLNWGSGGIEPVVEPGGVEVHG